MRRRAGEARELKAKGLEPVLKGSRWWFLKRAVNLTEKQVEKLAHVVRYNLRTVRSYLLKEEFHFFWDYISRHGALAVFWINGVTRPCVPGSIR